MNMKHMPTQLLVCSVAFFALLIPHHVAYAISVTTIPTEFQNLVQDPNTKVIVHDATIAAQVSPTPIALTPTNTPSSPNSPISVDIPVDGTSLVVNYMILSGKGPPNTLITVNIYDTNFLNPFEKHQPSITTIGTTTSDRQGIWV